MECSKWKKEIDRAVEDWSNSESAEISIPDDFLNHTRKCGSCRKKLFFISTLTGNNELAPYPPLFLSNRIAVYIRGKQGKSYLPGKYRYFSFATGLLTAAAAFIFLLGIWFTGLPGVTGYFKSTAPGVTADKSGASGSALAGSRSISIKFVLEAPQAQKVSVVGDWNGWDPDIHQLRKTKSKGIWEIEVFLVPGKEYRYQFLIDEEIWQADPESILQIDDGFGNVNSVLEI